MPQQVAAFPSVEFELLVTVRRLWQSIQSCVPSQIRANTSIRDIVGLYMSPPEKALVLCVDEKSQIHALDRTAPPLPMRLGQIERRTHDYKRHGTNSKDSN